MEIKVVDVLAAGAAIIVDMENDDKSFKMLIPESEYRDWLKYNDLKWSYDHIKSFAAEYVYGIINTDDTANIILGNMFYALSRSHKVYQNPKKQNRREIHFRCNDVPYMIAKNQRTSEYSLWWLSGEEYRQIKHHSIIVEMYKILLLTTRIVHNNPN